MAWITISCERGHFHSLNITLASGHTKIFHWRILFTGDGNSFACGILYSTHFFRILKVINFGIPTLMYGISGLFMTKYTEEVIVDGKSIVIHFWYQENRNSPNWIISNQAEKLECVKGTLPFFARICWGFFRIDLILYLLRPNWALLGPYWTFLEDLTGKGGVDTLPKKTNVSLVLR